VGAQHRVVFRRNLAVVTTQERDLQIGVASPVVLFQQKHINNPRVVLTLSKVDQADMSAWVDKPVLGVIHTVGGHQHHSPQIHGLGDEQPGLREKVGFNNAIESGCGILEPRGALPRELVRSNGLPRLMQTPDQNARVVVNQRVPVLAQVCCAVTRDFTLEQHLKGIIMVNEFWRVRTQRWCVGGQRIELALIVGSSRIPLHNRVLIGASLDTQHASDEGLGREILSNLHRAQHTIHAVQNLSI
jgi:hypothetical protein